MDIPHWSADDDMGALVGRSGPCLESLTLQWKKTGFQVPAWRASITRNFKQLTALPGQRSMYQESQPSTSDSSGGGIKRRYSGRS